MNKSEAKFHNTAVKMNEALFRILEKKDFSEISVLEICKEAGVNRSTFYAHYDNTYELLQEARTEFIKNFFNDYSSGYSNFESIGADETAFISPKHLIPYLEMVKKHKKIFKIFVSNLNTFDTDEIYEILLKKLWIPACQKQGITDNTVIDYMARFYLNGMTSIIMQWIKKDCEDDILFICEILTLCVRHNHIS